MYLLHILVQKCYQIQITKSALLVNIVWLSFCEKIDVNDLGNCLQSETNKHNSQDFLFSYCLININNS